AACRPSAVRSGYRGPPRGVGGRRPAGRLRGLRGRAAAEVVISPGLGPRRPVKYPLLDPLRGIAALWVFVAHYQFSPAFVAACGPVYPLIKSGHLGVPMFFVISGYCIVASARSSLRRGESAAGFLFRRGVRILPPFWCSILVIAALPFMV